MISGFSAGMEILLRLLLSGISHPCALMTAPSERLSSDVRAGRVVHVFLKFYYQKMHSVHIFIQNFFFWHFFCHPTNSLLKHSHLGGVWLRGCCEMNTHEYTQMTPFNHWRVKNDLDSHRIFLSLRRTYHLGCCQVVWGEMGHFSKVGSGCVPNYILVLVFFTFSTYYCWPQKVTWVAKVCNLLLRRGLWNRIDSKSMLACILQNMTVCSRTSWYFLAYFIWFTMYWDMLNVFLAS